ncbi:hypothetical protein HYY75_00610 [bacterium]|nr:hypothetical protein [bacterium]
MNYNCSSERPVIVLKSRGFTILELIIGAGIAALIGLVLMTVFRSNLISWRWGQKHMEFNQKVQLAMKQVFTDIKNVNPVLSLDANYNLWFAGEKGGDLLPNLVRIINSDNDLNNGGEELLLIQSGFSNPGEITSIKLMLENGALIRETTDKNGNRKRAVVSNKVNDLHFSRNSLDINEVRVSMIITDDNNPDLKENLSFAVHLDTDLTCVLMQ